ncbi:MAG: YdeI/OmpD-associated family protein [Sporichthyaceae bacterium]
MAEKKGLPVLELADAKEWEDWLAKNHGTVKGVWLRFAKKGVDVDSVTYPEAVEVALCQGWIDGQAAGLDDAFWLQRFTPRGPRSKWSQINCARAERLIEAGRMQPAGHAAIEAARQDGRWDAAYAPPSTATVPPDLQAALDASPDAAAFFATLTGTNRYAILYRVEDAKRPETRARRIEHFVEMLGQGQTLHP